MRSAMTHRVNYIASTDRAHQGLNQRCIGLQELNACSALTTVHVSYLKAYHLMQQITKTLIDALSTHMPLLELPLVCINTVSHASPGWKLRRWLLSADWSHAPVLLATLPAVLVVSSSAAFLSVTGVDALGALLDIPAFAVVVFELAALAPDLAVDGADLPVPGSLDFYIAVSNQSRKLYCRSKD